LRALVLVLDDQVRYSRALQRAIGVEFDVIVAESLKEAKEKMSSGVRLVLSDVRLDEANPTDRQGLDFVRWVRDAFPAVPIVAMSALDDSRLDQDAIGAGASKFLRKPITVSTLRETLSELVGISRATPGGEQGR
jgi:DNA-binding NtrC family response regulator